MDVLLGGSILLKLLKVGRTAHVAPEGWSACLDRSIISHRDSGIEGLWGTWLEVFEVLKSQRRL
jgi:hypothetical protein